MKVVLDRNERPTPPTIQNPGFRKMSYMAKSHVVILIKDHVVGKYSL